MNEPRSASPPRRRAARWLFAVGAAVVFAGALELVARIALPRASMPVMIEPLKQDINKTPPEYFRADPTLFWTTLPNVRHVDPKYWGDVTNAEGLRMRREVGPKSEKLRVVCLGDSCTYGLGFPVDDSWPSMLDADPALDVLNAGVPGYSSYQGALYADMRCPAWKPDVVILEYGINDSLSWLQFDHGKTIAMTDVERAPHVRLDFLVKKSALLGWAASLLAAPAKPRPVSDELLDAAHRAAKSEDREYAIAVAMMNFDAQRMAPRVMPDEMKANLLRMAAHAPYAIVLKWPRRRVLDPAQSDPVSPLRLAPYDAAIRATASDRIDVIDLEPPLVASHLGADEAYIDPIHGTPALNAIVARVVREKIRARLGR